MFCVRVGELKTENRYDPIYYADNLFGFLVNKKFEIVEISSIVKSLKNGFAAGLQDQSESGILHIRPTNLNSDNKIKQDKNIYISKTNKNHKKEYLISKNSVLFNNTNSQELVGKSVYFNLEEECFYSNHITNIVTNEKINPIYLTHLLNLYHKLKIPFRTCTNWNNQSGVGIELLKTFKIPLPPLPIQHKLADLMDKAYALKKAKETEARVLLDSIDGYVVDKLGIKIEEKEEKKVFAVSVNSLFGGRIDPKAFSSKPVSIIRAMNNSKYPARPMQEIIKQSFSGEWGADEDKKTDEQKSYNVIRNTNFVNQDNLSFENVAIRSIDPIKFNKVKIQKGDILIEKSGGSPAQPVGRVALFELEEDYTFSNFLQCFRLKDECNSAYYFTFMKYVYNLGLTEFYENQTTGIKNLIMESFVTIPIPLPPLPIQQSIATEVMSRRARAKVLQAEAKEILEVAKTEFEREILD